MKPKAKKHRTENDPDHVARVLAIGPIRLHGVSIRLETKINFRLLAQCPCPGRCRHGATRTFTHTKGLCSSLGDAEAYAYVGAWLLQAPNMTKEDHGKYRPTVLDVLMYVGLQHWQGEDGVCRPGNVQ